MTKRSEVEIAFERALEQIQARVSVLADENHIPIAVAYSGGLDSSVLLHLACRYAQFHPVRIYAFHVHHGLSGNADEWLKHCCAEAGKLGAIFDAVEVRIDADSVSRNGTEQAARAERYKALKTLCQTNGIRVLLAAHHQDDQTETLMLQLMRGAGLPGLSGMAALQDDHALLGKDLLLVRPLLEVSRAALEDYAGRHTMSFVTDESNQDPSYRRNALRHQVFPLLEEHFPGFSACVARSASHLQSAQHLLEELAESDLKQCRDEQGEAALRLEEVKKLSSERCNNVLRHWLAKQGVQIPSTAFLEQVRRQFFNAQQDRQPLLELGLFAFSRIGDRLFLRPNLGTPPKDEILLQWRGEPELAVPQWRGTLVFERNDGKGFARSALLDAALAINARRGHEKLTLACNRPSKSLKNLFQEAAVPAWQREWLPLLYVNQELAFVAGLGMDVRHCSSEDSIALSWRADWQNAR